MWESGGARVRTRQVSQLLRLDAPSVMFYNLHDHGLSEVHVAKIDNPPLTLLLSALGLAKKYIVELGTCGVCKLC